MEKQSVSSSVNPGLATSEVGAKTVQPSGINQ